jgi:hypothetical protein
MVEWQYGEVSLDQFTVKWTFAVTDYIREGIIETSRKSSVYKVEWRVGLDEKPIIEILSV